MPVSENRPANEDGAELRTRIVHTFVERAKEVGVRAVSTDDMARSLSISKKTLYKIFRSKEDLVREVLNGWEEQLRQPLDFSGGDDPRSVVHAAVGRWYDNDAQFKPVFWDDVGNDYPALRKKYFDVMFENMRHIGSHLTEFRKPGMSKEFGLQVYMLLMMNAPQPEFYEKARMNRREAVMKALDVWLDGVFDLPDRTKHPEPEKAEDQFEQTNT
ncbi:TetR/AcrR family transcriptional regulator [Gilvimarinus sp. F26214L]|uniref:TetR/AcrR family transcriptional regulator n=1 Tax=Gilvimarinus sp. DZF01 TaxID=3461371 RepID=UPI004045AAF8